MDRSKESHPLGASLYFGELIVQHPFLHAGTVKKKFSPVENPRAYRQEFLKTVGLAATTEVGIEPPGGGLL